MLILFTDAAFELYLLYSVSPVYKQDKDTALKWLNKSAELVS
jgi:hypothetical protein